MIIYEVNASVPRRQEERYRPWLRRHIAEILALPGFCGVRTWELSEGPAERISTCCHYYLPDQEALDAYLQQHAPRLRQEAVDLFGAELTANRRVLREICL